MKKNNGSTIVLICFLGVIAISLLVFMSMCIVSKGSIFTNFQKGNMEVLEEKEFDSNLVEKINVEVKSSDIHIVEGLEDKIQVKISGNKKEQYEIELSSGQLKINKKGGNYFCIGFCYMDYEIEIRVPKNYSKELKIKTASGNVVVNTKLNSNVDIQTISGDIEVEEVMDAKIKSTSGDIEIQKGKDLEISSTSGDIEVSSCHNIDIVTTSGEVSVEKLELSKNSKIKTVSGDVEINRTNDIYIDTKTISGDIDIRNNNRKALYSLLIETTSGDIEVD